MSEVSNSKFISLQDTHRADRDVAINTMFIEGHTPRYEHHMYGIVLEYNKHRFNRPDITYFDKENKNTCIIHTASKQKYDV